MRTSYNKNDINYGDLIESVTFSLQPKSIVEIGILDGFSLEKFINNSNYNTSIFAYDLFDKFNGNHANKDFLIEKFKNNSNVSILEGDFFHLYKNIDNIDIIHIDIANNGDILEFTLQYYLNKLSKNGIILFEGGSIERDNVEWMNKYNKPKINPIIKKYQDLNYNIKVFGNFPSITIIKK